MDRFFENPLQEQQLIFSFPDERGATRYERWDSHIARTGKKAVDFIYPEKNSQQLIFTEVKDFRTITRVGRFGKGKYSIKLANNVAQKVIDTFSGFDGVGEANPVEEQNFVKETEKYTRCVVFHWEFNSETSIFIRKLGMMLMKQKLRKLLREECSRIRIENMEYNPSILWSVSRAEQPLAEAPGL